MFYSASPSQILRFGDIVRGYVNVTPRLKRPLDPGEPTAFELKVTEPDFLAVLSPCCSIRDKVILLAPLIPVLGSFFRNPFFADDLTRINQEIEPEQSLPPAAWEKLSDEERAGRISRGRGYAFLEFFVYAEHDLLPPYEVHRKEGNIETRYYMIDFRNAYRVDCEAVVSPENAPVSTKLLELTVPARGELRQKIAHFYSREPQEDLVV